MPLSTGPMLQHRYRVVTLLGQGGMGAVYRVWDIRLHIPVAVKELVPQPDLDAGMLNRLRQQFMQEARILACLDHPHLVNVSDYFDEGGKPYLVMTYVEGKSLAVRIEWEGAQDEAQVRVWAGQLLDALAYCYGQGVIHRDVKPENVIPTPDGKTLLVDFGLVKLWDPKDARTNPRGPNTGEYRLAKGGSWYDPFSLVRSTDRSRGVATLSGDGLGFRCVRIQGPERLSVSSA